MSTEQHNRILRAIAQEPKTVRHFTDGNFGTAARHVRLYVEQLQTAGLLTYSEEDDTLSITREGLAEINRPTTIAHHREHCNASMPNWQPAPWACPRAGSLDFKKFSSKGMG
jgi:hypothetical protein